MSWSPLKESGTLGQSLWLDYIRQDLIETVNACREHGEPKARLEHPVYAESFRGVDHLRLILEEAEAPVNDNLTATLVGGDKS